MMLLNESHCGFVLADIKGFTSRAPWLKLGDFQNCAVKLQFVFWRNHLQADGFGFGGFWRPVQKLHLRIASRDALGVDRTPGVVDDLQKQQFCASGFQGYLRTQSQNKRLIETGGGRKTGLGLGDKAGGQHGCN
jgi:hypothetical protein